MSPPTPVLRTEIDGADGRSRLHWKNLCAELVALALPAPFPSEREICQVPVERGDGHAVLVIPASMRSDRQTEELRAFVSALGYAAYGWGLGVNMGPTTSAIRQLSERLAELAARHGPVSLVGFSMGGLFARLLAVRQPMFVRQVISVCSPIREPSRSVWLPLDPLLRFWPGPDLRALSLEIDAPLTVPFTCVYSKDDGIVRWAHCLDKTGSARENLEVRGRHVTMPRNAAVIRILAQRLGRPYSASRH